MKFFTRTWANGELSDAASNETIASYEHHLNGLAPRLPATIRCLARELNLHDGFVRRVVYDRSGRELRLELRCGDNQMGYFDLDLMYFGATLDQADVIALQSAARDPETEVLYDEVDVAGDGAFLHRRVVLPQP